MTTRCEAADQLARALYALQQMRGQGTINLAQLTHLLQPTTPCQETKP